MFKNQPINEKEIETIIGPSVKIKGDFETKGSIQLEGRLEGTLKIGNDLIVGDKAQIIANLQAKRIMVSGKVSGNIKATESLELTENAKIDGDIEAKIISIDPGAQINGKIKMLKTDEKSSFSHSSVEITESSTKNSGDKEKK